MQWCFQIRFAASLISACIFSTQVHGLKPGRRYAFRMLCCPEVVSPLSQPPPQTPSPPIAIATPAREPDAPALPSLSARARTSLIVSGNASTFCLYLSVPANEQQAAEKVTPTCEYAVQVARA